MDGGYPRSALEPIRGVGGSAKLVVEGTGIADPARAAMASRAWSEAAASEGMGVNMQTEMDMTLPTFADSGNDGSGSRGDGNAGFLLDSREIGENSLDSARQLSVPQPIRGSGGECFVSNNQRAPGELIAWLRVRVTALDAELSLAREGERTALEREVKEAAEAFKATSAASVSDEKRAKAERMLRSTERERREKVEEVSRLHLQLKGAVDGLKRKTEECRRMQQELVGQTISGVGQAQPRVDHVSPSSGDTKQVWAPKATQPKSKSSQAATLPQNWAPRPTPLPSVLDCKAHSSAARTSCADGGSVGDVNALRAAAEDRPLLPVAVAAAAAVAETPAAAAAVKAAAPASHRSTAASSVTRDQSATEAATMDAATEAMREGADAEEDLLHSCLKHPENPEAEDDFVEGPMSGGVDPYRDTGQLITHATSKAGLDALLAVTSPGMQLMPGLSGGEVPALNREAAPLRNAIDLAWVPVGGTKGGDVKIVGEAENALRTHKVVPIALLRLNPSNPNALHRTTTAPQHMASTSAKGNANQGASASTPCIVYTNHTRASSAYVKVSADQGPASLAAVTVPTKHAAAVAKHKPDNTQTHQEKVGKPGKAKFQPQYQQGQRGAAIPAEVDNSPEGFSAVPTFKASSLLPFEAAVAGDPDAGTLDFDFDLIAEKGSRAAALSACASVLVDVLKQEAAELAAWDAPNRDGAVRSSPDPREASPGNFEANLDPSQAFADLSKASPDGFQASPRGEVGRVKEVGEEGRAERNRPRNTNMAASINLGHASSGFIVGDPIERVRMLEAGFEALANAGSDHGRLLLVGGAGGGLALDGGGQLSAAQPIGVERWRTISALQTSIQTTLASLVYRRTAVHARHLHLCSTVETLSSIVAAISKPKGWEDDAMALATLRAVDGVSCERLVCTAIEAYDGWQDSFLHALRPAMDKTDRLLVGLHESIAEERRVLRIEGRRVHEGFLAAGNLLAAAEAFCWRLADERERAAQEHARLCAAADECEALFIAAAAAAAAAAEEEAARSARAATAVATATATAATAVAVEGSAAVGSAAAGYATAASGAPIPFVATCGQRGSAGEVGAAEASAWAELESLADMLLAAREAAITSGADRDLLALRGDVGSSSSEQDRATRRADRRQKRADVLAGDVASARSRLAVEHGASDAALDAAAAAGGQRRREAAAAAKAALRFGRSLADYDFAPPSLSNTSATLRTQISSARGNIRAVDRVPTGDPGNGPRRSESSGVNANAANPSTRGTGDCSQPECSINDSIHLEDNTGNGSQSDSSHLQLPRVLVELIIPGIEPGQGHGVGNVKSEERVTATLTALLPLLQALRHPSLPPIEAAFIDRLTGRAYLQRLCVERNLLTLEAWLCKGTRGGGCGGSKRELFEVCEIFRQLLQAVAHVHRRGMICAFLSPCNIHVTTSGQPLMLDLPIAQTTATATNVAAMDWAAASAVIASGNRVAPLGLPSGISPTEPVSHTMSSSSSNLVSLGKAPSFMHMTMNAMRSPRNSYPDPARGSGNIGPSARNPAEASRHVGSGHLDPDKDRQRHPHQLHVASAAAPVAPLGIPGYLAPELEAGGLPSPRSDLWSFGQMLFEAVFSGMSAAVDPLSGGVNIPQHEDSSVRSLLRSLLRTDPAERLRDAEEALAHPFFFGHVPTSVSTNYIVRAAWKAKMVRDYGRHVQSDRQPIAASIRLSSIVGTLLGFFNGVSGHALLHPIHLTVIDVPPGYDAPPMSAIYASFFAEVFDPRAGLFETFNSAALQLQTAAELTHLGPTTVLPASSARHDQSAVPLDDYDRSP